MTTLFSTWFLRICKTIWLCLCAQNLKQQTFIVEINLQDGSQVIKCNLYGNKKSRPRNKLDPSRHMLLCAVLWLAIMIMQGSCCCCRKWSSNWKIKRNPQHFLGKSKEFPQSAGWASFWFIKLIISMKRSCPLHEKILLKGALCV